MNVFIQFEKKPLLFRKPEFIISCNNAASFMPCFRQIEEAIASGYYLAGFFSYEAGYYFEEKLPKPDKFSFPLIYLGAYKSAAHINFAVAEKNSGILLKDIRLNTSQKEYFSNIGIIRGYIAKGDVYQITYCIKLLFQLKGGKFSFYNSLLKKQPVPYPAYIDTGEFQILSLSPEAFLKKEGPFIMAKPMKGTWPRGENPVSDFFAGIHFQYDRKNRAENVMIADLLRNDLGRIGCNIKAPRLFEVAKYNTLYQMTSTITARVAKDISIYKLLASLFPSGSVTGAPKLRAMQIIRGIEHEERKIYTGAIGYISPDKDIFLNVPIRTLLIQGESGEMGIGGGIVWDSTPQGEWDEGMLKAKFLVDELS